MNDREKKLTAAVGLVVLLWMGNWGYQKYNGWRQSAIARESTAKSSSQVAFEQRRQATMAVNKLGEWRERSLPSSVAVAQSQYRAWLVEQLESARLDVGDVSPQRSGQRSDAYQALSYQVTATGKLEAVVRFLDSFYRSAQLHKITSLRLTPQDASAMLQVSLTIEALVVDGTQRDSGLYEAPSDRLALASADEYVASIVDRNPFVAYKPPPPPRKERPVVVREERPVTPPRPKFNHAEHAKLTGVVSVGDDYQAWVWVQTLDERLYLRKGDEVKVGLFEGTVLDVLEKELVVETDEGVLAFRVGQSLTDGRQLASAPAGS